MSHYTMPTVLEKTPFGERSYDVFSRLVRDRIVFVGSEIDDDVANVIMAQLIYLESDNPDEDINLYINSPGGSHTALMAILDTMDFVRPDVATVCMGQAASAAAILLAAGAKGKRSVLAHSRVLLHQPSSQGRGTLADLSVHAKEMSRIRHQLEEILAEHTGQSTEILHADTSRDKIFTAQEAVDYGLADAIISSRKLRQPAKRLAS
ncbi:ATP-dependent endopeptidase clp proteolytic subunit [Renibacterium salmoninarum ATCC 33209]|uniref:ATP-dependent Clp protease proteolytic subunit n=1 Tax=Renibacterium salmoninarum (strain ATCC 33209 / DSM 20767 / JCM 11484 / NBRC 15589 / NCIMB 2235) TaxID=288705 RepID=A9WMM5_RENSM|nr:ATP-dependent Clp protease proteolytic subunit [Renibacterium salmoninarum]ABY23386.1 ATP-dependent endopeptidase clp proteolytic subunit [Renibacterium salmoninarum ATCC 33209]